MIVDPNGIAQAVAAPDGASDAVAQAANRLSEAEDLTSLLLFRAGSQAVKAVPLSLVTRLEELEVEKLEELDGRPVIQYRGTLIPIVYVNEGVARQKTGTQPMLIFSDGGKTMGLVVDEIVDIVDAKLDLQLSSGGPNVLGGAIVGQKAVEILDAAFYMQQAFGTFFEVKHAFEAGRERPRLLLVNDSSFSRALLEPVLKGNGFDVSACISATEALERLADDDFDAIVSDVDIPDMDGFSFAETIRGDERTQHVPIIALALTSDPETIERGRIAGFTDYVAKFDRSGLLASLREYARNKQQHGEAA